LFFGYASVVAAQQKNLPPEKRLQIEAAVSSFMSANSVPGIAVAVVLEGEPVWSAGFGMADLEDSAPVTSSTLFAWVHFQTGHRHAILQLWEQGKLDLDVPIQKYCPAFPEKIAHHHAPAAWPLRRHPPHNSDGKEIFRKIARGISSACRNP